MLTPKRIKIIIAALALGFIALCVYFLIPKTYIIFSVAPGQVTISINGKPKQTVNNKDTVMVSPGHYSIVVTRDEFESYTGELDVKSGNTTEFLVALNPQTDAARALLQDDASQAIIQRFHGNALTNDTEKITTTYPIISVLPIDARLYTVYACQSVKYSNDNTKIAVCVDLYQDGLIPYVLKDIQSRGYNPSDYEIIYVNKFGASTTPDI